MKNKVNVDSLFVKEQSKKCGRKGYLYTKTKPNLTPKQYGECLRKSGRR